MINQVIARYSYHGEVFELLLDADKLKEYRNGSIQSIIDILISNGIYRDIRLAKKVNNKMLMQEREGSAKRYDDNILMQVFGTTDTEAIAKTIIEKGEIQYTTEQRHEMIERKKKKIINIISSQAINPRLNIPYTPKHIENAMEGAKIRIDTNEHAEAQISRIMTVLKQTIPITIDQIEVDFKIPLPFAGRAKSELSKLSTLSHETWTSTEWVCRSRFYTGMKSVIYDKLNSITKGQLISHERK